MRNSRRIKRIEVTPEALTHMFIGGSRFECTKGLPIGAKFIGIYQDSSRCSLVFGYEHPDFEEIYEGAEAPLTEVEFRAFPPTRSQIAGDSL